MKRVLLPCRVATIAAIDHTATLATTVTGGVLLSSHLHTPGPGSWTTVTPVFTEATTSAALREVVFLLGVSGIFDLFDYLIYHEVVDFLKINGTIR